MGTGNLSAALGLTDKIVFALTLEPTITGFAAFRHNCFAVTLLS
jgi:hypothetical protein